jgi:protein O-mannosyl-transferase
LRLLGALLVISAFKKPGVIVPALLLLVAAVFRPVVHYPFTGFDDDIVVLNNPWVRGGIVGGGLRWAFTTFRAGMWFPLTWISHMVDVQLFGLQAGMHHLTNLLLHAATTALLFLLLGALTGSRGKSAFVAALFAVHPLHVESVVWVTERKDVLSGLFWVLTVAAYVRYVRHAGRLRYLALLAVFTLGLMTKPMLVTLPFVLLLLDFWPLGRLRIGKIGAPVTLANRPLFLAAEKLPLLALSAGISLVTVAFQERITAVVSLEALPLRARLANAVHAYVWYLGKTLLPTKLAILYPHSGTVVAALAVVAALLLLTVVSWSVLRAAQSRPAVAVGWLWYLGMLVPVIGLVQIGTYARADRFTYLPLIGLFLATAWGVPDASSRRYRALLPWAAGAVILSLAAAASIQVGYWRDDESLFGHALAVTRENWMVHGNLGATLMEKSDLEGAIAQFEAALRINPAYELARLNLGQALSRLGRSDEAERQFNQVLRQRPGDERAHFVLARHLADRGRWDEALPHLEAVLRRNPEFGPAQEILGEWLLVKGDTAPAIAALEKAVRLQPQSATVRITLGWAMLKAGKSGEALDQFRAALGAQPDSAAALNGMGAALGEQGRLGEAEAALRAALRLDPRDREIQANLAFILELREKTDPRQAIMK